MRRDSNENNTTHWFMCGNAVVHIINVQCGNIKVIKRAHRVKKLNKIFFWCQPHFSFFSQMPHNYRKILTLSTIRIHFHLNCMQNTWTKPFLFDESSLFFFHKVRKRMLRLPLRFDKMVFIFTRYITITLF